MVCLEACGLVMRACYFDVDARFRVTCTVSLEGYGVGD